MCNDCRGTHRHYHWLTFTTYSALEEHLRHLTHRDDQIQSIMVWWQDTRHLYKDMVSPITGAPLPVADAWRDAQYDVDRIVLASDGTSFAVARVQALVDDPGLSDQAVMTEALPVIYGLLDKMPAWPEPPRRHTAEEIAEYVRQEAMQREHGKHY